MRVELSPWKNLELQSITSGRRRRKATSSFRSFGETSNGSSENGDSDVQAVGLAFVQQIAPPPTKRSRRATLNVRTTTAPFAVLTTKNIVAVVDKKQVDDGTFSLEESERLHYACRPGISFCPTANDLPPIPAIYDSVHDRFYAVQKENVHLLSWPSTSNPDETKSTKSFDAPISSLSILGNSIRSTVYGSLRDNNLFVAYSDGDVLVSRTIQTNVPENARHVATFAQLRERSTATKSSSRKRLRTQETNDSHHPGVRLIQIFATDTKLLIVKHETNGMKASDWDKIVSNQKLVDVGGDQNRRIDSARVIGETDDYRFFFVEVRIQGLITVAMLSVHTGSLLRSTYNIPGVAQNASVINGVLTACCGAELVLFDAQRGTLLGRHPIHGIANTTPILLSGNSNDGCLVVVGQSESDSLVFSSSNVNLTRRLRLADSIATARDSGFIRAPNSVRGTLSTREQQKQNEHMRIEKALEMFRKSIEEMQSWDGRGAKLFEAFWSAAAEAASINKVNMPESRINNKSTPSTPDGSRYGMQRGSIQLNGLKTQTNGLKTQPNGLKLPSNGSKALSNGLKVSSNGSGAFDQAPMKRKVASKPKNVTAFSIKRVPTIFLSEAALVLSSVVVSSGPEIRVRKTASMLLKMILETRRINARIFPAETVVRLLAVLSLNHTGPGNMYTGTAFAFDLFWNCSDLSESQMVACLHCVLSLESPANLVSFIKQNERRVKLPDKLSGLSEAGKSKDGATKPTGSELTALRLFTVSLLVKQMLAYSELNGLLLTKAVLGLPHEELVFLADFLPTFVTAARSSVETTRRLLKIIASVADSLDMQGNNLNVGSGAFERLQTTFKNELRSAQDLALLQDTLHHPNPTRTKKELQKEQAKSLRQRNRKQSLQMEDEEDIPEYSIERLVF